MKYQNITIKAGTTAINHIKKYGLRMEDIKSISAAAGGPKWFVIYHLTKYIAEHILPHCSERVHLLGSSVGAWQMSCLSCKDPGEALSRLRDNYAGELYNLPITTDEVSRGCKASLDKTFSDDDISYILNNKNVNLNIFAAKGKGIINSNRRGRVYTGLLLNFLTNILSRRTVDWSFQRHVFSSGFAIPFDTESSLLSTVIRKLDHNNFRSCLMATAAIPLVMNGVDYITELEGEVFWDGGLTDYHMTLPYHEDGLVLIPHFLPELTPGWMDKSLKYRRGKGSRLSNSIVIHPSNSYVKSLPKGKITSRDDFMEYGEDQDGRAQYWTSVSEQGKVLADELDELIKSGDIAQIIQKF